MWKLENGFWTQNEKGGRLGLRLVKPW